MLKFLRKYQKSIFAVVAFMVIASFSFFGTYGAMQSDVVKEEDSVIGKVIDGSNLSSKQHRQLVRFLDSDFQDVMNGNSNANMLNDGFIRNDIIKAGLGAALFDAYKADVSAEFLARVRKFKEFKPYVHPGKFTGFETMIQQFAVNYYDDLIGFRDASGEDEIFQAVGKLYVDQSIFPSEMMRRMMMYVEYQYASMAPSDPNLRNVDLTLFYAKSASDWFGQKFIEKIVDFIINGAAFAVQKGYKVSMEEAKSSLLQLGAKHLREIDQKKSITNEELNKFYRQQISMLQMDEKDALKAWQKVLVLRKMLDEVGSSIFVDSVLYKDFSEYASKGANLVVYKLPKALILKKPEDVSKLEIYLNGVAKEGSGELLPLEFMSVDAVKKRCPELVEQRFIVKMASVNKESLVADIGVRRTWDWQLDPSHFAFLQEEFPILAKCKSDELEARFAYLETLDESVRDKIDLYARKKIVDEEPELIKEKLAKMDLQTKLLSISLQGDEAVLPGLYDRAALIAAFENESDCLNCYSENGEQFYKFQIVDKSSLCEILTFEEANQRGILDSLLKKANLKKQMASPEERLVAQMKKMREAIIAGDESVLGVASKGLSKDSLEPKSPLQKQWSIQTEDLSVTRKMAHPLFDEKLFDRKEGDYSDVETSLEGPIFYRITETFVDNSEVHSKMEEGRSILGREAKQALVKELLEKIGSNGS